MEFSGIWRRGTRALSGAAGQHTTHHDRGGVTRRQRGRLAQPAGHPRPDLHGRRRGREGDPRAACRRGRPQPRHSHHRTGRSRHRDPGLRGRLQRPLLRRRPARQPRTRDRPFRFGWIAPPPPCRVSRASPASSGRPTSAWSRVAHVEATDDLVRPRWIEGAGRPPTNPATATSSSTTEQFGCERNATATATDAPTPWSATATDIAGNATRQEGSCTVPHDRGHAAQAPAR